MNANDYWAIAEQDLEIQNPTTDRKLRLLDDYCDIRDGMKVLDIGCGKAWVMRQWADHFAIEGVGIDTNPSFLQIAAAKRPQRGRLDFFRGPATDFPAPREAYDIVLCLGSAFSLGGFVQAVDWMTAAAKPGAAVVIGDLTLKHKPLIETHQRLPLDATELIRIIERHGAEVSATISASDADFERYVSHHRHATLRWARQNISHPDHSEVLQKSRDDWTYYLSTVRPLLGWTIFVGRRMG